MNLKAVLFLTTFLLVSINAQDAPEVGHIARFGGGIGYTPVFIFPDFSSLNAKLNTIGFPKIESKALFASGGAGYIYFLLENVRIGAFGYTGSTSETNSLNGFNNEAQFKIANLGFSIEYTLPYFDGFGVSVGALIGGGSVEIDMYKNQGNYTWDGLFSEVQNGSQNINKRLTNSFFSLTPTLNVDIPLNRFLFFRAGAGYQYAIGKDWKVDNDLSISNVPSNLNGSGFYLQTGIFIGLVTY